MEGVLPHSLRRQRYTTSYIQHRSPDWLSLWRVGCLVFLFSGTQGESERSTLQVGAEASL